MPSPPVSATRRQAIRAYLLAHGHPSNKVTALALADVSKLRQSLRTLMGVTEQEYKSAGGKGFNED